jgi:2,4-dienoyl-CoA reductase-like NADH-dependent reductase (Old Yellow Enzyme family)
MTPQLFTPIQLGGITLPNRIVIAPMCQYSADDGSMTDWHHVHLGSMACSGAGLFVVEKTNVTREGRITHGCTGLYSDHNEAAMARAVQVYRGITKNPIGIQIGHAGRKASAQVPWAGGKWLGPTESPWPTGGPSAIAFGEGWHVPHEFTREEIRGLVDAFVASTLRAKRIGFDLVELHSAHGYLLQQFLSPLSNKRTDEYGKDRMKFPLEVARAVREVWPRSGRSASASTPPTGWTAAGRRRRRSST